MPNTNSISQSLIDQLNDSNKIVNSFSNSFDFDLNTNTFNISWDNTAQTITDPYLNNGGKVTVNKNYLPTKRFTTSRGRNLSTISAPPEYLTGSITLFRGSDKIREIPILFSATISNNLSASYVKESPVGSSSPIVAFNSTGEETFPFSFVALADYLPSEFSYSLYEKTAPNGYYQPSELEAYTDFTVLSETTNAGSDYVELTL